MKDFQCFHAAQQLLASFFFLLDLLDCFLRCLQCNEDTLAVLEVQKVLFVEVRNEGFDALSHFVVQNRCHSRTA